MKRILCMILAVALLFCGCAAKPVEDTHPEWDAAWFRAGDVLAAEPPSGFALNESNDVLSVSGLYYATWTQGEAREIVSDTGRDATAYDAQIYLLVKECKNAELAETEALDWIEREQGTYETDPLSECPANGQCWRILPLRSGRETNPYQSGRAAFTVRGDVAICVELLCAEGYTGNAEEILNQFLAGFHFHEGE